MHKGKLIRLDSPKALREGLEEACYAVSAPDPKDARRILEAQPGVLTAAPSGAKLHVFVEPGGVSQEQLKSVVSGASVERITPSLEDVFIALVSRAGTPNGN
jgi:ABC-2 type transport system ATP-binding protein